MFIIIPLVILIVSFAGIFWLISRKFVYLKKLTPEVVESVVPEQEDFLIEFFPGLAGYFQSIKLRQYRLNFLAEFEKFLRKLRLLSLQLNTATERLIHRVRKSVMHHEGIITGEAAAQAEQEIKIANGSNGNGASRDWKEDEHKLILEIATNPKDAGLYKKLGNIYMRAGEWRDAVESFKKAVELDPEDETTRNKLGRAAKKLE